MKKKMICLFLVSLLILLHSFAFAATEFHDFNSNHWAYQSVMELVEHGVINGYEDGTFRPEQEVSREEFLKMLYCIGPSEVYVYSDIQYEDVSFDRWSSAYIEKYGSSLAEKIDNKYYFYPSNVLRREEVAKVLSMVEYSHGEPYDDQYIQNNQARFEKTLSKFQDLDKSSPYLPYICTAVEHQIMNGVSENSFSPETGVTRAQAATLLQRVYYAFEKEALSRGNQENEEPTIKDGMIQISQNQVEKLLNNIEKETWYEYKINHTTFNLIALNDNRDLALKLVFETSQDTNEQTSNLLLKDIRNDEYYKVDSYVLNMAKVFGFSVNQSDDKNSATFTVDMNGKTYFIDAKCVQNGKNYQMSSIYDMIFFIMNHVDEIKNASFRKLEIPNDENSLSELSAKYQKGKKYYYGINKEATIEFQKNQMLVSYVDQNGQKVVDEISFQLDDTQTLPVSKAQDYAEIFGLQYIDYNFMKIEMNQHAYIKEIHGNMSYLSAKNLYNYMAFVLLNNGLKTSRVELEKEEYQYTLNFQDIITKTPPKERSVLGYGVSSTIGFAFDRSLKSIDAEVLNSYHESVLAQVRLNANNTENIENYLELNTVARPGETYTVVLKNAVDFEGNATPKDEEYTYTFSCLGEKLEKTGKPLKFHIEVPEPVTKDSSVLVTFTGDIPVKDVVSYRVEVVDDNFNLYGGAGRSLTRNTISMSDIISLVYDYKPGTKVKLTIYSKEARALKLEEKHAESVIFVLP